jgi:hypothetical protein
MGRSEFEFKTLGLLNNISEVSYLRENIMESELINVLRLKSVNLFSYTKVSKQYNLFFIILQEFIAFRNF